MSHVSIKTHTELQKNAEKFKNMSVIKGSPKCFEGSMLNILAHLSVLQKSGRLTPVEVKKTKKLIFN